MDNFTEQLNKAKSLVGKMCQFQEAKKKVGSFRILTKKFEEINGHELKFWKADIAKGAEIFDSNGGWVIVLMSEDELGVNAIQNVSEIETWRGISINNHTPERLEKSWKFGCAEISFGQIKKAAELIKPFENSNREMTKITFGVGTFTAEEIKILAEYS